MQLLEKYRGAEMKLKPTEPTRETTAGQVRMLKATGWPLDGDWKQREATGGNGRPREATGAHGRPKGHGMPRGHGRPRDAP